jgi:hypothetical protein
LTDGFPKPFGAPSLRFVSLTADAPQGCAPTAARLTANNVSYHPNMTDNRVRAAPARHPENLKSNAHDHDR